MAQLAQAPRQGGLFMLTQMCGAVPWSIQPLLCKLGIPQPRLIAGSRVFHLEGTDRFALGK